jgi:hypothetical protein
MSVVRNKRQCRVRIRLVAELLKVVDVHCAIYGRFSGSFTTLIVVIKKISVKKSKHL